MDDDYDGEQQPEENKFAKSITEGWKQDRRPDFLSEAKEGATKTGTKSSGGSSGASDNLKRGVVTGALSNNKDNEKDNKKSEGTGGARDRFTNAERGAVGGGFYTGGGITGKGAREKEENPDSFSFTGKGIKRIRKGVGKHKIAKVSAGAVAGLILSVLGVGAAFIGSAQFTIGNLDFNLMESLGYSGTVAILEKQALRIIKEWLMKGILSDFLCDRLASQNFMVGQLTKDGDFVRTNTYIADAEKLKDLAVLGNFQVNDSHVNDGELAILYNGERIIAASDFLETVEENPKIRAILEVALEMGSLYYYGEDAETVFGESGIKKSLFSDWKDTGDLQKNERKFYETLGKALNDVSDLALGMVYSITEEDDSGNKTTTETSDALSNLAGSFETGEQIVNAVRDRTKDNDDDDAGKRKASFKAGQLLNQAVSAGEPYLGASSFSMIEEVIQRTRINPNETPINELMNYLQRRKRISYEDIITGEEVKTNDSVLTTPNFAATVSNGRLSQEEAVNFSRDRCLVGVKSKALEEAREDNDSENPLNKGLARIDENIRQKLIGVGTEKMSGEVNDIIRDTRVKSNGKERSDVALHTGDKEEPYERWLRRLDDTMQKTMIDKNTSILQSTYGGNRTVEGGAFLSNMINTYSSGAMWSDDERIKEYHAEVKEELAKKAEAQRAIRSPFDITSPYTFLGSIAHSMSNAMIRNGVASKSGVAGSVVGTFADLAGDSLGELFADATADGNDYSYEITHGDFCYTAKIAENVEGDVYCNPKTTLTTKYMDFTYEDWKHNVNFNYYENEYVEYAMDRKPSAGILDSAICEKILGKRDPSLLDDIKQAWNKVVSFFTGEVYSVCNDLKPDELRMARGETFAISKSNVDRKQMELYSGYALYDKTASILEDRFSLATEHRHKYYAEHPLDNSRAGKIARISGLSKKEAEVAVAYSDYLTYLALYNPAERYSFVTDWTTFIPSRPLVDHSNQVSGELYAVWYGRTTYDDLKGKIQVV